MGKLHFRKQHLSFANFCAADVLSPFCFFVKYYTINPFFKSKLLPYLFSSRRHEWIDIYRNDTQGLRKAIQDIVEFCFIPIFIDLPRRCLFNIFVCSADNRPDFKQGHMELKVSHMVVYMRLKIENQRLKT